jgi:choline kinase
MIAILLAAGVGRRLSPFTDSHPKCLVEVGGRTLLDRHLDALASVGIRDVAIVVGHLQDKIRANVVRRPDAARVQFLVNPDYTRGSVLSLHTARELFDRDAGGALIMDADVLYPHVLLARLVAAPGSALLLDARSEETGEEMMLGVKDGRVRVIDRRIGDHWELKGEGVGFFKVAPCDAAVLREELDACVAAGETGAEYEAAIDRYLKRRPAGFVRVDDLPWTEIDFEADVARARSLAAMIDAISAGGAAAQP